MHTNYKNFVSNKLNEDVSVYGELKNLFNKMLTNLSEDLRKPIFELLNKLNNSKDTEDMKKQLITYLKIHSDSFKKSLNETKNTSDNIKITRDNLISLYSGIDAFVKNIKDDHYTFETIFKNSNNGLIKKLFIQDEKYFYKNVEIFARDLIIDLSKQLGYNKEDIIKDWETSKTIKSNESIYILEEVDPTVNTDPNTTVQNTVNDVNNSLNDVNDQTNVTDKKEITDSKKTTEVDNNLIKLRTNILNWFDNILYKPLKEVTKKEQDKVNPINILQRNIEKMELTDNKESIIKILNSITQINDKNTLIELRDFLNSKGVNINKNNAPL